MLTWFETCYTNKIDLFPICCAIAGVAITVWVPIQWKKNNNTALLRCSIIPATLRKMFRCKIPTIREFQKLFLNYSFGFVYTKFSKLEFGFMPSIAANLFIPDFDSIDKFMMIFSLSELIFEEIINIQMNLASWCVDVFCIVWIFICKLAQRFHCTTHMQKIIYGRDYKRKLILVLYVHSNLIAIEWTRLCAYKFPTFPIEFHGDFFLGWLHETKSNAWNNMQPTGPRMAWTMCIHTVRSWR